MNDTSSQAAEAAVKSPSGSTRTARSFLLQLWLTILTSIVAPLLVYYVSKLSEPKAGELIVQSDVDSTQVFVNGELKGLTGPVDTSSGFSTLQIHSVYPGSHQLTLRRKPFLIEFFRNAVIDPGRLTAERVGFKLARKSDDSVKLHKANLGPKNRDRRPPTRIAPSESTEERPSTEERVVGPSEKPVTRRLTIWLPEEFPLSKVGLYVNSSFMGMPSSTAFSVELPEGRNDIEITYSDASSVKYVYSVTKTISDNETLIIKTSDFSPLQRH
jgi:hypothetical protein